MTTHIRHPNTKPVGDPKDPAQLISCGVAQNIDFGNFQLKKIILWCHQRASDFFAGFFADFFLRTETFPLAARHNCAKFGLHPKRGSEFPKEYSLTTGLKKYILLAILFSLYWNSDPVLRMPKGTNMASYLISLIWDQEHHPIIKNFAVWKSTFAEFLPDYKGRDSNLNVKSTYIPQKN